jgi:hypothetical protein
VLALLSQARYDNGEPISNRHIADELVTMMSAGHETTGTTLAWAGERLRRHPRLLSRLTEEVDAGGSELRHATICELRRTWATIDGSSRRTKTRIRFGDWVIPEDTTVIFSIQLAHFSEDSFPDAASSTRTASSAPSRSLRMDSVRRRRKPLYRRGVRQHGNRRHPAHTAPRIPVRANP